MKKILLLAGFLIATTLSFGQSFFNTYNGGFTQMQWNRGAYYADKAFINKVYPDTTTAGLDSNIIKNYPGSQIITADDIFWFRSADATHWVQLTPDTFDLYFAPEEFWSINATQDTITLINVIDSLRLVDNVIEARKNGEFIPQLVLDGSALLPGLQENVFKYIGSTIYLADTLDDITLPKVQFFSDPVKGGAFRAGVADIDEWNVDNIGAYSAAFNRSTKAIGENSTAFGLGTISNHQNQLTVGRYNDVTGESIDDTLNLFVVGNGTTDGLTRKTIMKVTNTGVGINIEDNATTPPIVALNVVGRTNIMQSQSDVYLMTLIRSNGDTMSRFSGNETGGTFFTPANNRPWSSFYGYTLVSNGVVPGYNTCFRVGDGPRNFVPGGSASLYRLTGNYSNVADGTFSGTVFLNTVGQQNDRPLQSQTLTGFEYAGIINNSGSPGANTIRGFYFNPTLTAIDNTTVVAFANPEGNNILNSTSGNTVIGPGTGDSTLTVIGGIKQTNNYYTAASTNRMLVWDSVSGGYGHQVIPTSGGGTVTGTGTSGQLTQWTGTSSIGNVTTGTGVITALGVNTGSAGAFVVNGGALGTPSSGTLTNATQLPLATGITGFGTGGITFLGTPTSANFANFLTDETGTAGNVVFSTSPTITGTLAAAAITASSTIIGSSSIQATIGAGFLLNGGYSIKLTGSDGIAYTTPSAYFTGHVFTGSSLTNTSGASYTIQTPQTFAPTSGTGTFAGLHISNTINQTGGSSGVTRGLWVDPTLTAASDYRGIEVTKGSIAFPYVAKTATYSILNSDYTIDCTSGTFTATLPTAVGCAGRIYVITNSGAGTITIATTSSQTFANVAATPTTLTMSTVGSRTVQSNGANWLLLSSL